MATLGMPRRNAIDAASSKGGRIRIVVESRDAQMLVAVEDNGCGIPEEYVGRIFEPFFTTKEETGTGIGLWVTKELVEKNGGSICLRSELAEDGMRTRFEVCFPIILEAQGNGLEVSLRVDAESTPANDPGTHPDILSGLIQTR